MSKHTKAPWFSNPVSDDDFYIYGADEYCILRIPHDPQDRRPDEDAANARLIAAAPDLLAIAQLALTTSACNLQDPIQLIKLNFMLADLAVLAKRAIAKAEGKS